MKLSASLVLYKNAPDIVRNAVISLLNTPITIHFSVVDNSPTSELSQVFSEFQDFDIEYFHNKGNNVGFGKAHNLAIRTVKKCKYHLVMNPDVYFEPNVLIELIKYLETNQDVGLVTPKILSPNGEIQYLCKRNPSVFILFARRFIPRILQNLFKGYLNWYEMRETGYNRVMDVPYLSGCFMLFRKEYLDEIGYFDENIFMYLEDADITRRMSQKYRAIFYPHVHIYHHWARGSYKSLRLMLITIQSSFYLFNKYGWRLF
ncbi:MAG: glycosyltransferase family 2 protein [Prochloraceae cyanobacterium]|nr:glycosyltransferase family 2 protein [Prochloraceae cyanobacterium]